MATSPDGTVSPLEVKSTFSLPFVKYDLSVTYVIPSEGVDTVQEPTFDCEQVAGPEPRTA